jgi:hypothetical protein
MTKRRNVIVHIARRLWNESLFSAPQGKRDPRQRGSARNLSESWNGLETRR